MTSAPASRIGTSLFSVLQKSGRANTLRSTFLTRHLEQNTTRRRALSLRPVRRQEQSTSSRSSADSSDRASASAVPSAANSNDLELRSLTDGLDDPPPVLASNEKQVDWARSFHGLSKERFSQEASDTLLQKIDEGDVEIKPDGIVYLPEIKYRRILNRAFGPGGWGLAPRGETIVTGKIVTREYGLVANGRYVRLFLHNTTASLLGG